MSKQLDDLGPQESPEVVECLNFRPRAIGFLDAMHTYLRNEVDFVGRDHNRDLKHLFCLWFISYIHSDDAYLIKLKESKK